MSTLRVSNIEAKADPSSPSVDEKLKVTNSNGDILVHIDGKTAGVTTIGINTTDRSFTVDAAQNVEFLGIVTATKFSLSGGGEITGGDGNFTGIVTSGSGNFTGGLTVGTAVTAATANFTSSLTAASANFTGNVSIAGTLTYEDVTNVDSVGIATARTGIDVTGGHIDLADNSKIRVGTGDDLDLYHDTTDTYLRNQTGQFLIRGNDIKLQSYLGETYATLANNNAVSLYYDNSKKLETTSTGAKVTGALEVTQEYPSIRPTLDLNFAATKTLDRRITFTRDGVGTYTDELGIVKYVSNNVPRFDHDPTTGESLGLLIEESRTNQIIYSSDITVATAQNGTITGNATTAPDGTTTADQYAANSTNGIHRVDVPFTSGQISNSTTYSFSVFVKANGYDKLHIRYGGYNADNHGLGYDLSDGTTFAGKFDGTGSLDAVTSSSMIAYPNGWYRCSFTFTTAADAASGVANILYYVSNSEATTNFAGDGSSGMYFWGAQMEEGDFATSYIPTSGSTVTRPPDHAYIRDVRVFDFFNETEGTVLFEHTDVPQTTVARYPGIGFSRTNTVTSTRAIHVFFSTSNQDVYYLVRGPGSYPASDVVTMGASSGFELAGRIAFVYKANDFVLARNGTIVGTDTSGALPDDCFGLALGSNGFSDYQFLNAHIKSFKYYNKRLPNAQLQGLTQQ